MDYLRLDPLLENALREDVGRGDITSEALRQTFPGADGDTAFAAVMAREAMVVAGWPVFVRIFQLLGAVEIISRPREGSHVAPGEIGRLRADPFLLLKGERVALNLFQKTCGIATQTARVVSLVSHTGVGILDTRKTTPLWRDLEKYAVRVGGGMNHRWRLDDAILIKDNHIEIAGGVAAAVRACRKGAPHLARVEVEVSTSDQLEEAIQAGAEVVMLDNMSPAQVRGAVERAAGRCRLEASGGVTAENVVDYAEAGVDFISMGALTHSVRASDISVELSTPFHTREGAATV